MSDFKVMCTENLEDIITRIGSLRAVLGLIHNQLQREKAADALYSAMDTLKHIETDLAADLGSAPDASEEATV